ncbi:MAG TPA: DUF411 domain-containing protein [Gemmatimonadaceae bacterium]|jgi:hypothetical protein
MSRRTWLVRAGGLAAGGILAGVVGERLFALRGATAGAPVAGGTVATVFATETCGCCHGWMAHLKDNGFKVDVHYVADVTPYKTQYGVPQDLWSCHTARIGGYTIEGHVPADVIRRVLAGTSGFAGLAVPGMPIGSPGMEGPNPQPYQVVAFTAGGKTSVFAER